MAPKSFPVALQVIWVHILHSAGGALFFLLAAGWWGSGEVEQRNHNQHSLCVPSFLEVRGFRGIHEHPASQNKENMIQMKSIFTAEISVRIFLCFILLVEEGVVSPGGRGHLCLRACRVCRCYPAIAQTDVSFWHSRKRQRPLKMLVDTQIYTYVLSGFARGSRGATSTNGALRREKQNIQDLKDNYDF